MIKIILSIIQLLGLTFFLSCSTTGKQAPEFQRIQVMHEELKVIWPGSKIVGQKNTGIHFTRFNKVDGSVVGYAVGVKDIGTWDIEHNTICHKFKKWRSGIRECMEVYKNGNQFEMYTSNGVLWATITITPI